MVKIQNSTDMGPEYKPSSYKSEPYKPGPYRDPLKQKNDFKPKEYKMSENRSEYQPYKPTHVGIYGEKSREKKEKRPTTPVKRQIRRPRRTFESYSYPRGPDIRLGDTGPEYEVKEYQPTKYEPYQPGISRPRTARDPLKPTPLKYTDKPIGMYEGQLDYKIDENNNAGMRHWHYDYVDDTVAAYRTEGNEDKYKVERKPKPEPKKKPEKKKPEPKPKESKAEEKPIVAAAIIPVQRANSPQKKTFTTSSTQHVGPVMKAGTTQTQANKMKTSQTQYESIKTQTVSIQTTPTKSPLPAVVVPLVKSEAPKKVKTKSEGVQCSDEPKKVIVRGTQSDGPSVRAINTQTSPMPMAPIFAPVPVQQRTPQYAEEVRHQTPVYSAPERRTPSPTIVPIVAATSYRRRSPTPKYRTPSPKHRTPTPKSTVQQQKTPSPAIVPVVAATSYSRRSPTPKIRTPSPKHAVQSPPPKAPSPPRKQPSQARPISDSRWTPSPEVAESVPHVAAAPPPPQMRADSPLKSSPAKRDSPKAEVARKPSPKATNDPKNSPFPYPSAGSRLPPEVTACIEAYDCVHGPNNPAPSVQRSINLT